MTSNELNELRRSLDRMQIAFEALSDRYRDLRRERRQLRERIDELVVEREARNTASAVDEEIVMAERRRSAEWEERAIKAEKRHETLFNRINDLESMIAERERMIADQEDTIAGLERQMERHRVEAQQGAVESGRSEELQEEITVLRASLDRARAERNDLETNQAQLISKLDVATRAETMARLDLAELKRERDEVAATLEAREKAILDMKSERDAALANVETLTHRLKGLESSDDERLQAQRTRIEDLSRDLGEALDMAARNERELVSAMTEVEALRQRERSLVDEIASLQGTGSIAGLEDRQAMARQIDMAIELIDRHLGNAE